MTTLPDSRTWGMLCLGWAVGLSAVWAVLNWFPFIGSDSSLVVPVVAMVSTLLAFAWALDSPTERMERGLTLGFGFVFAASVGFMFNEITSFWFSGAALMGLLAYWYRLDRLAETGKSRLLRAKQAMAWLLFAAVLEGTVLLVAAILAILSGREALGMVKVVGFIWLNLSAFATLAGHPYHERVKLDQAKAPVIWVFLLPWSLCVVAFVIDVSATHGGETAVWGMVAAMALAGWTAFHNRRLILGATLPRQKTRGNTNTMGYAAKDRLIGGLGIAGGINIVIGLLVNPKLAFRMDQSGTEWLNLGFLYLLLFFIGYATTRRLACTLMTGLLFERAVFAVIALACLPWALTTYAPLQYGLALSTIITTVVLGIVRGERAREDAACDRFLTRRDDERKSSR